MSLADQLPDAGKPVIVATQLLESMIHHSRPTRAEASDVANAVLDGADALMLAGETSVGVHPSAAVSTMARIVIAAEQQGLAGIPDLVLSPATPEDAVAAAACNLGDAVQAKVIAVFTRTGRTAQRIASHRSAIPLMAFASEPAVRSQLTLTWGVETFVSPVPLDIDSSVAHVEETMLRLGRGHPGDRVVIVAGQPGRAGSTNTVRVHELGSPSGNVRAS